MADNGALNRIRGTFRVGRVTPEDIEKATQEFDQQAAIPVIWKGANQYRNNFNAFNAHANAYPDIVRSLREYYPSERTDRSPRDKASNYAGAYDYAQRVRDTEPMQNVIDAAKASQMLDYIQDSDRRNDAVMDYLENKAGVEAAYADLCNKPKSKGDIMRDAVIFTEAQGYADGGKVDTDSIDSAISDYAQLLDAYPNAKKFLSALQSQNFEPSDSQIVSTIMHPIEGAKRLGDKFTKAVNTVAGYPDLESANPLYVASPNEQIKSALDLAGTAGTGSMPFVEAGPATLGIFAGKLAKNAPTEKFFEADNLARDFGLYDASVGSSQWMQKNKDIWNQTGIHYGYDMKPRFEIPDTAFRLSTPEDYRNIVDQANANMQALTDESKLIRQAKKEPTPQTDLFEKELTKSRNQRLKDIKTELETTKQELSKPYGVEWGLESNGLKGVNANISMPHPELYKAYPQIGEDVVLRYEPRIGGGGKYFNNQIDIYGNPENESSRSTGIHELQHAIQELEGWNRGGNPEAAPYIRYQLARENYRNMPSKTKENANLVDELMRQKSPLSKVAYIHDLENIRQPRDLFNTDSWYKNSDTVRSLIGSTPRYGSRLPYAQKAGEVLARIEKTSLPYEAFQLYNSGLPREEIRRQLKNIDAKINRRWDDWRTASQARQEVVKSDPIQNKFSDQEKFDMYKRLAGEAEARAVQTRLNLTPEERAATFPLEDYDVNNPMVHYLTEFTPDNKYAQGGSVDFDKDKINTIIDEFHQGEYGLRPDQTEKGRGYLNELKRPDGAVMTEYSIGMPINGVEMDVPTLVPDLTIDEIKSILSMPEGGKIPKSVVRKAAEHAEKRVNAGKPVFATPEESEFGER